MNWIGTSESSWSPSLITTDLVIAAYFGNHVILNLCHFQYLLSWFDFNIGVSSLSQCTNLVVIAFAERKLKHFVKVMWSCDNYIMFIPQINLNWKCIFHFFWCPNLVKKHYPTESELWCFLKSLVVLQMTSLTTFKLV